MSDVATRAAGTAAGTALLTAVLLSSLLWTAGCGSEERTPAASPDTAAAAAAAAARASSPADAPTTTDQGRSVADRLADASLAARVKQRLVETQHLAPTDFDLRVTGGRVILEGDLPTRAKWEEALASVREVGGVDGITNHLTVAGKRVATAQDEAPPAAAAAAAEEASVAQAREAGKAAASKKQKGRTPPQPQQEPRAPQKSIHHRVERGESLWTIARDYDTSVLRLKKINDLRGGNLQPGQRLLIRKGRASSNASNSSGPAVADARSQTGDDAGEAGEKKPSKSTSAKSTSAKENASASTYHVVKQGESLWAIANQNGTTVERLKELNSLASNDLMPGDRLRVE